MTQIVRIVALGSKFLPWDRAGAARPTFLHCVNTGFRFGSSSSTGPGLASDVDFPDLWGMEAAEKGAILVWARKALSEAVEGRSDPERASIDPEGRRFGKGCGAFVSLHTKAGALRGCMGRMQSEAPLADVVAQMARASGLEDPRFPAVEGPELDDLVVELSILSPMEPALGIEDVEVGRHGLLVSGRGRQGVLLPQVATAQGWDRETFVQQTCRKAGLPLGDGFAPDLRLYRFTAEVFSDAEP